jgi:hypothetical protein
MKHSHSAILGFLGLFLLVALGSAQVRAFIGGGRVGGGPSANAGHSSHQPIANSNGLLAWWRLDGDVTDSSGNGNNGSGYTPANDGTDGWTDGKFGGGAKFGTANNDRITVPNIAVGTTFSISMWFKVTALTTYSELITEFNNFGGYPGFILEMGHGGYGCSASGGELQFHVGDNTLAEVCSAKTTYNDGQWHHVVAMYDGTQAKMYVDNVLSVAANRTAVLANSSVLTIGNYSGGARVFPGTLDDVRLYNRALSTSEIAKLYAGSAPPAIDQSVMANWKLDETSGTTVTDSIGGTVSNTFSGTPKPISGIFSSGYSFNGSTDYITVPDTASEDFAGATAISGEAWIYATGSSSSTIVGKGSYSSAIGYEFALNSVGGLNGISIVLNTVNFHPYYLNSTYSMPLNTWTHVAFTYNSALSQAFLYINGVKAAIKDTSTLSPNGALLSALGKMTYIGRRDPDTANAYFPGTIDDIRLYSRTLTDAEIYDHYLAGRQ